jgi:hypothetical protein
MRNVAIIVVLSAAACGGGGSDDDDAAPDPDGPFAPPVTTVRFEIDYETGNEPYTGPILAFGDTFDISVANLERLFSGTRDVELPTTTAEMEDIGAVGDEELTTSDLLALADEHRDEADDIAGGLKTFYLVWVSGYFTDGDGPNEGVLGVSIGDTGVVAMFKDVIESTGTPALPNLERFVEQSTLVHEVGHAVGLVDNGVPPTSDHVDEEHGAHCTNDACVMFWLNEGASDAAMFARDYVTSGDAILFDDACLADVDALTTP